VPSLKKPLAPSVLGLVLNKILVLFLILTAAAIFFAIWACGWPDGLESVAAQFGFEEKARVFFKSPTSDYNFPVVGQGPLKIWLAAGAGCFIVWFIFQIYCFWLKKFLKEDKN